MTKTRPFLSMCYGDPSATTNKLTFSTTSVLLLLNMPLSLSRATIFRQQKNPRRVYRPKIAGILFVYNEPEGKYYTVPVYYQYQRAQDVHSTSGVVLWVPRKTRTFIRKVAQLDILCCHASCVGKVVSLRNVAWRC